MASKPPRLRKDATQQVAEELGQLAWQTIYDLKTPIATIHGYAQFIADIADVDERRRIAKTIDIANGKMLEMINDLMFALSGLRSIGVDDAPQPCDLAQLVSDFIETHLRSDENPRVTVAPEVLNSQLQVWGFEPLLRGIILNLLIAAKHRSSPDQSIVITCRDDKEGIWLILQDQGPAVDDNLLRRPDRHSRTLVAASVFCKLHGGRLEAQNLPEGGAEFAVLFPRKIVISAGE